MINVQTRTGKRTAQIISDGPDRNTKWVRTCDDQPAAWLLVREWRDTVTGRVGYEVTERK
jgi:hypothetical protein